MVQLDRQGPGRVQQTLAGNGGLARVDPRKAWQGRLAVYYKAKFSQAKIGEGQTPVMHTLKPQEMLKQTQLFKTLN